MTIEPLGDSALIIRMGEPAMVPVELVANAVDALRAAGMQGVTDVAPGFASVAVFLDAARLDHDEAEALPDRIRAVLERAGDRPGREARQIDIPVCYDHAFAPDLAAVAQNAGLTTEQVVERHAAAAYRVRCVGFAPGFPYLDGLPPELHTPRRVMPRTSVEAGSVAIGGGQAGIYPFRSPGGWNVIGRTPLRLFSPHDEQPALLRAGDRVDFRAIDRDTFDSLAAATAIPH